MPVEAPPSTRFANRRAAGRALARALKPYADRTNAIVLALPRGGVPVAYEVARAIGAPLDVFVVRKLGLPQHPELAMGALASGGALVLERNVISWIGVPQSVIQAARRTAEQEISRQEELFRRGRPSLPVEGRTVILIDDGLATGSTMQAAIAGIRALRPARVIVAVPVASREAGGTIGASVDDFVCLMMPGRFDAVGRWYADFSQTSDDEIIQLLGETTEAPAPPGDERC